MMEVKVKGLDEAIDNLKSLQNKLRELEGKHKISLDELMTKEFMKKHTKYDNFNEFVINSNLVPEDTVKITKEMFADIPDEDFDKYIRDNTDFQSWKDMLQTSTNEYAKRKLGL